MPMRIEALSDKRLYRKKGIISLVVCHLMCLCVCMYGEILFEVTKGNTLPFMELGPS